MALASHARTHGAKKDQDQAFDIPRLCPQEQLDEQDG
jgi:hypothetical protein